MRFWLVLAGLVSYAVLTHQRAVLWGNEVALWQDAAFKAPCLNRPLSRLATLAKEQQNFVAYAFWMPAVVELETEGRCLDGSLR